MAVKMCVLLYKMFMSLYCSVRFFVVKAVLVVATYDGDGNDMT